MAEYWIALSSLSAEGLPLVVDNPAIWADPMVEFGLSCTVLTPLKAELLLLPQEGGCFVRGRLTGAVEMPCDRCAEPARIDIDHRFESFEPLPASAAEVSTKKGTATGDEADVFADDDVDACVIRLGDNGPEINVAALLWEELSLSLPVHPVCQTECRGLCLMCGKNLNDGVCACAREEGDPRLAALRNLTLKS